jgi:Protein of unknown function (DUF3298)
MKFLLAFSIACAAVVLIVSLLACNSKGVQPPNKTLASNTEVAIKGKPLFTTYVVKDSSDIMYGDNSRTTALAQWMLISGIDSNVSYKINQNILYHVCSVFNYDMNDSTTLNLDSVKFAQRSFINDFANEYDSLINSFTWYNEVYLDTAYVSDSIVAMGMSVEDYMGGAHGMRGVLFFNYSLTDGRAIEPIDYIADTLGLKHALEKSFREEHELGPNDPLDEAGLFQDYHGDFPLPGTMSFTSDGFIAIYNLYEIAPYSSGTIVIELSDAEILPLVKNGRKP